MSLVVDAQVHVWLPESNVRPWPSWGPTWRAAAHRTERVDAETLLSEMAWAGVDRAVLVPPLFEGHRNDYVLAAARAYPDRFRVMARLALTRPDAVDELAALTSDPLICGVRLSFLPVDECTITDSQLDSFWGAMGDAGVPVMILAPGQLAEVARVAQRHPQLRVAVDHLGLSGNLKDRSASAEIAELLKLAVLENISVKMTAIPCYSTEPHPHPSLLELSETVISTFGVNRVFWGSDASRLSGSEAYLKCRALVNEMDLSPTDRAAILGENLLGWLPWVKS